VNFVASLASDPALPDKLRAEAIAQLCDASNAGYENAKAAARAFAKAK
jgi:hypothetical protein